MLNLDVNSSLIFKSYIEKLLHALFVKYLKTFRPFILDYTWLGSFYRVSRNEILPLDSF